MLNENWDICLCGYYFDSNDGQLVLFVIMLVENNCFIDNGLLYGGDGCYYCGVIELCDVNLDYCFQVGDNVGIEIENIQISFVINGDLNENWLVILIIGFNFCNVSQQIDGDYFLISFQVMNFVLGGFLLLIISFLFFLVVYGYLISIVDFMFVNVLEEDELL